MTQRTKPASQGTLAALHRKFAEYLNGVLEEAMESEDGLPLDAATMGCISKFLKDNEITCEPEQRDDLEELRKKYSRQSKKKNVQSSVQSILEEAEQTQYLN